MAANETNEPRTYRVVHPYPLRSPGFLGQKWEHGVLLTQDATLAKSLTEYGCQVYEGDSQILALGTHTPDEQKRIETGKKWAYPVESSQ